MDDITWRKSSRSRALGDCAEVAAWRTSTRSIANGDCTEVGQAPDAVAVRDSKNPGGPVLVFGAGAWERFTAALKARH